MKEEQAIRELRKQKEKWKKLYEEGKDKDKYERRTLLRQMNRIEDEIAKKDLELAKIDLGIRSVDKMDSILSKGKEIFKGEFWTKIEGTLTSEKVLYALRSGLERIQSGVALKWKKNPEKYAEAKEIGKLPVYSTNDLIKLEDKYFCPLCGNYACLEYLSECCGIVCKVFERGGEKEVCAAMKKLQELCC